MKLGFSGMGNMASAILHIVLAKNLFTPEDIFVFDKQIEKMDACKSRGVSVCKSNVEVIDAADILILAVKPQYIEDVLGEISSRSEGKCIVSIAAGITSDYLKAKLSPLAHVVRIMPNTPLMVSEGGNGNSRFFGSSCRNV